MPATRSAAREHDGVAVFAQERDDRVAVLALQLDHTILRGAADAAALLQPPGELAQAVVVERHARDGGDRLAAPAGGLAPHLDRPTATRTRGGPIARPPQVTAVTGPDEIGHAPRIGPGEIPHPG